MKLEKRFPRNPMTSKRWVTLMYFKLKHPA